MIDRRAWDPFAPIPRATRPRRPAPVDEPAGDDLDRLKKADLIEIARVRELDTTGTRGDLIARIRETF